MSARPVASPPAIQPHPPGALHRAVGKCLDPRTWRVGLWADYTAGKPVGE